MVDDEEGVGVERIVEKRGVHQSRIESKFCVGRRGQQMEKLFWDQINGTERWEKNNNHILYIQISSRPRRVAVSVYKSSATEVFSLYLFNISLSSFP